MEYTALTRLCYLCSEREECSWVRGAWWDELPTSDEDRWLVSIVDSGRDLEVVVEELGHESLADTTFEVSVKSIRLRVCI